MDETTTLRMAFIAGFLHCSKIDMAKHMEDLKTINGLDLEAEIMAEGFDEFMKLLPEVVASLKETNYEQH